MSEQQISTAVAARPENRRWVSDPVPAITEAAATGETAAIFADIRQVLGVDVVNLIWRHLATIDGALPWAWETLRPLYADGSVISEATALHKALALPPMPAIPAEVFAGLGLHADDLAAIRGVLAAYDHTNAMAAVALTALRARLDGRTPHDSAAAEPAPVAAMARDRIAEAARPDRHASRDRRPGNRAERVRHAASRGGPGEHVSASCPLAVVSVVCLAAARAAR
jgi:hypothetical protein